MYSVPSVRASGNSCNCRSNTEAVEKYTTCSSHSGLVKASSCFTASTFTAMARSGSPQAVAVCTIRVALAMAPAWGVRSRRSPTSTVTRGWSWGTAVSLAGSRSSSSSSALLSRSSRAAMCCPTHPEAPVIRIRWLKP